MGDYMDIKEISEDLEVVVTRGVVLKKIVPGLKHKISNSNILQ
jgi:hypothetical protein